MELGTSRKRVRCACPRGHVFTTLVHDSVDVVEDAGLLGALAEAGMQLVRCPHCGTVWPIAEPILMHDRPGERLALFLPEVLAHRELEVRTNVLQRLVASDLERIPLYAADFDSIVGVDALERWLGGVEDDGRERENRPQGAVSMIPRIHSAFADLDEPERSSTTSIPPAPTPEEQPVAEDDWLDDSEIEAPRKSAVVSRPALMPEGDSGSSGRVDFVGLMSEGEEDEAEDADDNGDREDEEVADGDVLFGFDKD